MNRLCLIMMLAVFLLGTVGPAHSQVMGEIGSRWSINAGDYGPEVVTLGAESVDDMNRDEVRMCISSDLLAVENYLTTGNLWFLVQLDPDPNATYSGIWWDGYSSACWRHIENECALAAAYTHWEKADTPPEMLDIRRIQEIDKQYYDGGQYCTVTHYCWHNCSVGPDHCSPNDHYNFDLGTVDLHEDMHAVAGCGHIDPCDPNSRMFRIADLDCFVQYLGFIDTDFVAGTLAGIDTDLNEPANDYSPGAINLGLIDELGEEQQNGQHRLPGYLDQDWFSVDVGYVPDSYVKVYGYPQTNTTCNLAMTVFWNGTLQGTVNHTGAGENEIDEFPLQPGRWTFKIYTPPDPIPGRPAESTYSRAPNPYRIRVMIYRPVADVPASEVSAERLQFAVSSQTGLVSGSGLEQDGTLTLYDTGGRRVWNRPVPAHREWSERIHGVTSGIYFVRLATGSQTAAIRKVVVVR